MKRFIILVAMPLLFLSSCTKETAPEPPPSDLHELTAFVAKSLSVSENQVTYKAGVFTVDNDMNISIEDARLRIKETPPSTVSGRTNQRAYSYIVSPTNVQNIRVYIDSASVPKVYWPATDLAIQHWNETSSKVHMQRVYAIRTMKVTSTVIGRGKKAYTVYDTTYTITPPAYDVIVTGYYESSGVLATCSLPTSSGYAGNSLRINTFQTNNTTDNGKTLILVHELGHSVGLAHSNTAEGNYIPGTPTSDPPSVMNSTIPSYGWNGFTDGDLIAIRYLYPI